MDPVGDRAHLVAREHVPRRVGVAARDAVDVARQVEGEPRHVQAVLAAEMLQVAVVQELAGDPAHEVVRELVVARLDRRVGGEHAHVAHAAVVVLGVHRQRAAALAPEARQELDREQRRVALVHVVGRDVEAERPQDAAAADAEHDLLLQPVDLVTAIQVVGDVAVPLVVLFEVGIEQQHRHLAAGRRLQRVEPRPDPDLSALDRHGDDGAERHGMLGRLPRIGLLLLPAELVDRLAEIALPRDGRDEHHRQVEVGRRERGVAREHAEPSGIGMDRRLERDLHGEVGDAAASRERLDQRHRSRRDGNRVLPGLQHIPLPLPLLRIRVRSGPRMLARLW